MKRFLLMEVALFVSIFGLVEIAVIRPVRADGYRNLVARVAQANARERKVFEKVAKTFDLYALYKLSLALYKMLPNARGAQPQVGPDPGPSQPQQPTVRPSRTTPIDDLRRIESGS